MRSYDNDEIKRAVSEYWPRCKTREAKEALALTYGIVDKDGRPSLAKLYNLASRLNVPSK